MNITKETLLEMWVEQVRAFIREYGLIEMARTMGAFWQYDYNAAKAGRVGMHALLKSGLHSDGFFVSRILLEPERIRKAVALDMVARLRVAGASEADYIAGIPDGATKLGIMVADIFGSSEADMMKEDGRITLRTPIPSGATILLVEDVCTRGTGFMEAVREIKGHYPDAQLLPFDPVIINRGGLEQVDVQGVGAFKVVAIINERLQDWTPEECPLCSMGSKPIKPKATDENWHLITTSQLL